MSASTKTAAVGITTLLTIGGGVTDPGAVQAPADLADRLVLALVNECVAVLREERRQEAG